MGYVDDSLQPGEVVSHRARTHWGTLVLPTIGGALSAVVLVALPILAPHHRYRGEVSIDWTRIAPGMMLAGLIFLVFLVVFAIYFARLQTSEYAVTNRRIILKRGWIRRHAVEIFLAKVESLEISQGIFGRMLDFGTLHVVGSGGSSGSFDNIEAPMKLRQAVQESVRISRGDAVMGV